MPGIAPWRIATSIACCLSAGQESHAVAHLTRCGVRGPRTPHRLDEAVHRDGLVGAHDQRGEEELLQPATDRAAHFAVAYRQWTEKLELRHRRRIPAQ